MADLGRGLIKMKMKSWQIKWLKYLRRQLKAAKGIIIEDPEEIVRDILGKKAIEFEILIGEEAYCANEEIYIDFQGKEMRIYIDRNGKLSVYTD